MDKSKFSEHLEIISRCAAVLLVAVYVVGFLVVSFHNSLYGIEEFSFLRARVLAAGILFALLFLIAALESSRIFGLFGIELLKLPILGEDEDSSRPHFAFFQRTFLSFTLNLGTAMFLVLWLMTADMWRGYLLCLLATAICIATNYAMSRGHVRKSVWRSTLIIGVMIVIFGVIALEKQWTLLTILFWLQLVSGAMRHVDVALRQPTRLIDVNWPLTVINAVILFTLYAAIIYPAIKPVLGGGKLTPVTIQFSGISPLGSPTADVFLIDETDAGYYFTRNLKDHKGVFVPRSSIAAVYFQDANT
jgi:hypothetical protein